MKGVYGADVSEYEGKIDWAKLTAQKKFVIIRYSHGAHIDSEFATFWPAAKQTGVMRGAYHYLDPSSSYPFASQVRNFVKNVRLEKGEMPPVLDLEKLYLLVGSYDGGRSAEVCAQVGGCLSEKVYGVRSRLSI